MTDLPPPQSTSAAQKIIAWLVIGTVVRLLISAISVGSSDVMTWYRIAVYTHLVGIVKAYSETAENNHPLLPVYWAQLAAYLGGATWFTFVFKLPYIAFDAASAWLAARMCGRVGGPRAASRAAAAVALSPIAILISGYHGNSDSGYAFFVLLSANLLMSGRFFGGGLALGAAINVKLIPIMLVPMAFSFCRRWRDASKLLAALLLAVIPFIPLLLHPALVRSNMLKYASWPDRWGVTGLLMELFQIPSLTVSVFDIGQKYNLIGRVLIVGLIFLLASISFKSRRWSPPQLYLLGCLGFLIFAPGFGLQYLTLLVPLLAVVSLGHAWTYNILAGLFAGVAYVVTLQPQMPLFSVFPGRLPQSAAVVGFLAWALLIQLAIQLTFKPTPKLSA